MKRLLDVMFGVGGSIITAPIIVALIVVSTLDTREFGLFRQRRVGLHGRPISVLKIRTMRSGVTDGSTITVAGDERITRLGRWIRRVKLDELPQLWLVAIGTMSLVGPRPDVFGYADRLSGADRIVLELRPGITGPASVLFRSEEELLASHDDPVRANDEVLWPAKVAVNRSYALHGSLRDDLRLLLLTVKADDRRLVKLLLSWDRSLLDVEGVRMALGSSCLLRD